MSATGFLKFFTTADTVEAGKALELMVMDRIDTYSTHEYEGYRLRAGHALPFGATLVPGGVNFSIFSSHATSCTLVLFEKDADKPLVEIPFLDEFRIGNVYSMTVFDIDYENIEYGFAWMVRGTR